MALSDLNKCDPAQPVEILFEHPAVVVVNGWNVQQLPLEEPVYYRLDSCILSGKGDTLTLRNRNAKTGPTTIEVRNAATKVTVRMTVDGVDRAVPIDYMKKVVVTDSHVTVNDSWDSWLRGPEPVPKAGKSQKERRVGAGATGGDNGALKQENEQLKKQLAEAETLKGDLQKSVNQLQKSEKDLRAENAKLTQDYAGLQGAVEAGLDRILEDSRSGQLRLSEELRNKLETFDSEIGDAETQIRELEEQVTRKQQEADAAQAHLKELQDQLSAMNAQKEVVDLDCEAVSKELESLRIRLQMNGDVVALTESRWLKNNSVADTMEEMEKKMDAVEDRIGFILKAREQYGFAVQAAVLRDGDGAVSTLDESGTGAQHTPDAGEDTGTEN